MSAPASRTLNGNHAVGARLPRLEDDRHLAGQGCFVADLQPSGLREVVFVRSPVAHGRIVGITPPDGLEGGQFWTAADVRDLVRPITATMRRPDFKTTPYHIFAQDKVRYVGEIVAAVVAADRAQAEDIAEQVYLEIDQLDPITNADEALANGSVPLHDGWSDNRYLEINRSIGDIDAAVREADLSITREYRMARLTPCPLEPRASLAMLDTRLQQLNCYITTQRPHLVRTFLAEQLIGVEERSIRVIAPDVGGGFGGKATLYPEDVAIALLALQLRIPVRWVEDRWEAFVAGTHAREQIHRVTAHVRNNGEILGIEAEIVCDGGAYSMHPPTAASEANMAANVLPGPYKFRNYRFKATTVCTNKTPVGPFRGVGRPAGCFAMERTIDEVARALNLEPYEVRLRNMIQPQEFPYENCTGLIYDSGDYPAMVRSAVESITHNDVRQEQAASSSRVRVGVGYGFYIEQTAHGAEEWRRRGASLGAGFESARVRLHPSGTLTVDVGIQSHGQGLETTLAQIASDVVQIPYERISVRHGDTEICPYGLGTVASRSVVMAGSATHQACVALSQKLVAIGAALLGCRPEEARIDGECVVGPGNSVSYAEIANAAYLNIHLLPDGVEAGLEAFATYRPPVETGAFSAGLHAAKVSVDLDTGQTRILDYTVVEDCGRVVNPMIVDGQIVGGLAQGIGQALYEELRYSEIGQPKNVNFADYILAGPTEVPSPKLVHQETLSPFTVLGMKGTGEGGCIAPPAAIANAVADALKEFAISVDCTPISAASIWSAIEEAGLPGRPVVVRTREILR